VRIIAGSLRGRRLFAPRGETVRPTAERVREAIFNVLAHAAFAPGALAGAQVLDAFAGTGGLGFEALSRGAGFVTFLDTSAAALAQLRRNAEALGVSARVAILRRDGRAPGPAAACCSLVFLDPPYRTGAAPEALSALREKGWIAPEALIVVEQAADEGLAPPAGFAPLDERRYGGTRVTFLRAGAAGGAGRGSDA